MSLTAALAARPDVWRQLVRHDPVNRWYQLLLLTDAIEAWLIRWTPGQATEPHDHGGAAGALTVAEGTLTEEVFDGQGAAARLDHPAGTSTGFGAGHVHRVGNRAQLLATSIHACSPPNRPVRRYVRSAAGWVPERLRTALESAERASEGARCASSRWSPAQEAEVR